MLWLSFLSNKPRYTELVSLQGLRMLWLSFLSNKPRYTELVSLQDLRMLWLSIKIKWALRYWISKPSRLKNAVANFPIKQAPIYWISKPPRYIYKVSNVPWSYTTERNALKSHPRSYLKIARLFCSIPKWVISQPHAPPGMAVGSSNSSRREPTPFLPLLAFATQSSAVADAVLVAVSVADAESGLVEEDSSLETSLFQKVFGLMQNPKFSLNGLYFQAVSPVCRYSNATWHQMQMQHFLSMKPRSFCKSVPYFYCKFLSVRLQCVLRATGPCTWLKSVGSSNFWSHTDCKVLSFQRTLCYLLQVTLLKHADEAAWVRLCKQHSPLLSWGGFPLSSASQVSFSTALSVSATHCMSHYRHVQRLALLWLYSI